MTQKGAIIGGTWLIGLGLGLGVGAGQLNGDVRATEPHLGAPSRGMKRPTDFRDTHLGRIGRSRAGWEA